MTIQKVKNVYKIENENTTHDKKTITISLPEFFIEIIKGSKKQISLRSHHGLQRMTNGKYLRKMEEKITLRKCFTLEKTISASKITKLPSAPC